MKTFLTTALLLTGFNVFAQAPDLIAIHELAAFPKAGVINVQITDSKPAVYKSYNFGKVVRGSITVVQYNIENKSSTPLDFLSGTRTNKNHIKGNHTCRKEVMPGEKCVLYFYYNPIRWGNHEGKGIIEFAQGRRFVVSGSGKSRFN